MFIAKDVAEALGYADCDKAVRTHCKRAESYPARVAAGESKIINRDFVARVMDELDLTEDCAKLSHNARGPASKYFDLTEDQMRLVGMRESKAVRRAVLAELNRLYAKAEEKPKSLVDMLKEAVATIEAQEQQIRDRALRGVMVTPKHRRKSPRPQGPGVPDNRQ